MDKSMKVKLYLCSLVFPTIVLANPQEVVLKKLNFSTENTTQLCELLPQSCKDKPQWTLYHTASLNYYLIDDLKMYQLSKNNNKFKIQQKWDFTDYQPISQRPRWASYDEEDKFGQLSIFPKLFPINESEYSIAIIQSWSEGYSGGGMGEEVADFLKLKSNGQYQQVFQNIPFSMNRMIRACFSEKDYKESGERCHDEYALDTQIVYLKPYTWQLRYHYQAYYSPVSDSGSKPVNLRKNYLLTQNKTDVIVIPESWD